jgi:hypothetical protein
MSEQAILAIIGILASTVGALIWVIKYMFDKILPILEGLKTSVELNTIQTKENEEYLKKRNGSDSIRWDENTKAMQNLTDMMRKIAAEDT